MKYEIILSKTEGKTVQVFSENFSTALKAALESNPGFTGDSVLELLDEDEPGEEHVLQCRCEGCGAEIWDDEEYTMTDDGSFCLQCLERAANQPK